MRATVRLSLLFVLACGPEQDGRGNDDAGPGTPDAAPVIDARPGRDGAGVAITCATQWPPATSTAAGYPTEPLFAQLKVDGVTPSGGNDPSLRVEVGVAPAPGSAWSWFPAIHNPSCLSCGDREEWMGAATPTATGAHVWGARVAYGPGAWTICDGTPPVAVAQPGALRAVTMNLRCLVDDWDRRLPILADGLAAEDADVYGFQEACAGGGRDNLSELVDALAARTGRTYEVLRTVTHRSWSDSYDEGIAVVTPHRIGASRVVDLPPGVFPRKSVLVRLVGPQGPFVFGTTHLDHLNGDARAAQSSALRDAALGFVLSGEGTILSGDMNEGPGGGVQAAFSGASFADLGADAGPTFPASAPTDRIDQVWLRAAGSGFGPEAAARILTAPVDGVLASDHVGLSVRIGR